LAIEFTYNFIRHCFKKLHFEANQYLSTHTHTHTQLSTFSSAATQLERLLTEKKNSDLVSRIVKLLDSTKLNFDFTQHSLNNSPL